MLWYKAKWIDPFFAALNTVFPDRQKASDGTIGDIPHMEGTSGHNPDDTSGVRAERSDADSRPEVRAADAGTVLNRLPLSMWDVVLAILRTPRDRDRLIYIIFDGWIWRAVNGWRKEEYPGKDKHRTHVHLSGDPNSDEDSAPWTSILGLGGKVLENTGGDDMSNTWTFIDQPPADQWRISQNAGRAYLSGQARDTVLAIAAGSAADAASTANAILAEVTALRGIITDLINNSGGSLDVAALLSGVDERLATVRADFRDAVADLGEGGAQQVRGPQTEA